MTNTDTLDVAATAKQARACVDAGSELIRITTPSPKHARALGDIRELLAQEGITVPLIADIHFLPAAAFEALKWADKVRLNPGNFLDGKISTSTFSYLVPQKQATSTLISTSTIEAVPNPIKRSEARLRPWLEDFFHEEDKSAKRPFGTEKIRLQIDAAEKSENHGWLLWNAANVYTENALNKE